MYWQDLSILQELVRLRVEVVQRGLEHFLVPTVLLLLFANRLAGLPGGCFDATVHWSCCPFQK